jgi:hypothetical protein
METQLPASAMYSSSAAAHRHATLEDVPRVVERVVHVQRGRVTDGQCHLHHGGRHARRTPMLDHEGVEEPPCLGVGVVRVVDHCCVHVHPLSGSLLEICWSGFLTDTEE